MQVISTMWRGVGQFFSGRRRQLRAWPGVSCVICETRLRSRGDRRLTVPASEVSPQTGVQVPVFNNGARYSTSEHAARYSYTCMNTVGRSSHQLPDVEISLTDII